METFNNSIIDWLIITNFFIAGSAFLFSIIYAIRQSYKWLMMISLGSLLMAVNAIFSLVFISNDLNSWIALALFLAISAVYYWSYCLNMNENKYN